MLKTAIKAARDAGTIILRDYARFKHVNYKSSYHIVTKTDLAAEAKIVKTLRSAYPRHNLFSEEAGEINKTKSDYLWVIDPLDGTTNFVRGLPHFGVSIGLTHKGQYLLGVVYQPLTKELFTATTGKGAYLNGRRIHVGKQKHLKESVIFINRGSTRKHALRYGNIFRKLTQKIRTPRVWASVAVDLCYVASGKIDALIMSGCNFYDSAAGLVIASEAGATICDFNGNRIKHDINDLVITNKHLKPGFLKILKNT